MASLALLVLLGLAGSHFASAQKTVTLRTGSNPAPTDGSPADLYNSTHDTSITSQYSDSWNYYNGMTVGGGRRGLATGKLLGTYPEGTMRSDFPGLHPGPAATPCYLTAGPSTGHRREHRSAALGHLSTSYGRLAVLPRA